MTSDFTDSLTRAWLGAAQENREAAADLRDRSVRGAISMAYYAGFAAITAIVCHLDRSRIPARGSFTHGAAPSEFLLCVRSRLPRAATGADLLRQRLEDAYNLRVVADYKPMKTVSSVDVADAVEAAEALVRFAERVCR